MNASRIARPWHVVILVVASVAVVLQIVLVLAGQNVIDQTALAAKPEAVRRLFSYFTIQANLLVIVSMGILVRGHTASQLFRVVRLASLVGITVTGVVAAVALPPSPTYTTLNLVCDRLLHIVVPVLTFVAWVVVGPRGLLRRGDVLPALIWPVAWLVATLSLGPLVDWYPYPFVDVASLGLGRVLVNCAAIALLFLALCALALWGDRRLPRSADDARVSSSF